MNPIEFLRKTNTILVFILLVAAIAAGGCLFMRSRKPIKLNAGSLRDITLTVTPEEIDRRGPGLILNWAGGHGERLLVWTE